MLRLPYTPTRRNQRAHAAFEQSAIQQQHVLFHDPHNPQRPYRTPEANKNGMSKDRSPTSKAASHKQTPTANLPSNHNMIYASFKRGRTPTKQQSFMACVSSGVNDSPYAQAERRKGKNHSIKFSSSLIGKSITCAGRVSVDPGSPSGYERDDGSSPSRVTNNLIRCFPCPQV
jgi:hypothetical protein